MAQIHTLGLGYHCLWGREATARSQCILQRRPGRTADGRKYDYRTARTRPDGV